MSLLPEEVQRQLDCEEQERKRLQAAAEEERKKRQEEESNRAAAEESKKRQEARRHECDRNKRQTQETIEPHRSEPACVAHEGGTLAICSSDHAHGVERQLGSHHTKA